jgi:23S rRNA maturation-related 3'-5' exoribonuclease YhaM
VLAANQSIKRIVSDIQFGNSERFRAVRHALAAHSQMVGDVAKLTTAAEALADRIGALMVACKTNGPRC